MHPLPNETWLEAFRFIPLPTLGLRVALCSSQFQEITDMRILGSECARTIEEIVIFGEHIGLMDGNNQHFRRIPIPDVVPPLNVHIKSITVYCNLVGKSAHFLRLFSTSRPSTLQLDGSRFVEQFGGARNWPKNVQKLVLARYADPFGYHNGRSLFHAFTEPDLPIFEVPLLECHLSEPDNGHLREWLDYMPSRRLAKGKRGIERPNRLLVLKGDPMCIQQFLRDIRRQFACATEPRSYQVQIECEVNLAEWSDKNWATKEHLELCKSSTDKAVKHRNCCCYILQRVQPNNVPMLDEQICREYSEMALDSEMGMINQQEIMATNIVFK